MKKVIFLGMALCYFLGCLACQDRYREGRKLIERGELKQAEQFFKDQLNAHPDDPLLHNEIGLVYAKMKKPEQAIYHYSEALKLKPDFPECHYNLGTI